MYDYLRFHILDATHETCQDKCIQHPTNLVGISTYSETFCYCWYTNLPSPLPSDIHGSSANHLGSGKVSTTLNEADGDCYKFISTTAIETDYPTLSPSLPPTFKPTTAKPTPLPTQKPTSAPSVPQFVSQ
jgi:hypothetical protein